MLSLAEVADVLCPRSEGMLRWQACTLPPAPLAPKRRFPSIQS
jgi:hypothetical protein